MTKWVLFRLDAETAHRFVILLIRLGIRMGNFPLRIASGFDFVSEKRTKKRLLPEVFGLTFLSRHGLAAGFDKNAEILEALPVLGFGFAEIGTVTPRPQPGNTRPRLFRDPANYALFNRMGFNSLGTTLVSERLSSIKDKLPAHFRVGINLGKNKDTPIENAADDYVHAAAGFEGLADYLVINVSSPNTPNLRSLQTVEALKPIVGRVLSLISKWKNKPPLLLKLAPELTSRELSSLVLPLEFEGIEGWILTNTLAGSYQKKGEPKLEGGWSGGPLKDLSTSRLEECRSLTRRPIISVGGILSAEDAAERIRKGADLIQVYTGWIYGGPEFPGRIYKRIHSLQSIKTQRPQTYV